MMQKLSELKAELTVAILTNPSPDPASMGKVALDILQKYICIQVEGGLPE